MVMSWIAGFCGRSGGCAAGPFAVVSVCHLFDAYLHTTSSVLVHRATVSVSLAICGYACAACVSEWCAWFSVDFQRGLRGVCGALSHDCTRVPRGMRCASRAHAPRAASPRATRVQACSCARSGGRRVLRATQHTLSTRRFFFTDVHLAG
jgi:hypothetical protein